MSRRKIVEETPVANRSQGADTGSEVEDAEGHSIGLLLGMMALDEAEKASTREHDRHRQPDDLKPITKSFPNLRHAAIAEAEAARIEDADQVAPRSGVLPEPTAS